VLATIGTIVVDGIYKVLASYHAGELASVLGLFVSVVGFLVTIIGVWRSKKAAQRAEEAAKRTRETMTAMQSIVDLSSVLAALGEVKTLHRASAWNLLPDRYGSLRVKLIAVRTSRPRLTEKQRAILQGTIQHLADLEKEVDRALASSKLPSNIPRLTSIISDQIDKLTELLVQLHREELDHG
jgi:hypothetical protein